MNKITLGIFAFAIIAMLGVGLISAQGGLGFKNMNEEDKAEFQADREAIRNAVEAGDYQIWKSLMEERISLMQERLTEEEFQAIQERHQEREENREGFGQRKGMGMHRGTGEGRRGGECPFSDAE